MSNIFIISAPSGCGKTSLVKKLITIIDNLSAAISHTTRKPRKDEINAQNYYFVNNVEFDQIKASNGFLECAQVFDNQYGSAKQSVQNLVAKNHDVILEIDWQGAQQVKQNVANAITIFILPPSLTELENRLRNRAADDDKIINKRMLAAKNEIRHFSEYDYLIINDDFNSTVNELKNIISAHRLTLEQQQNKHQDLINKLL